MSDLNNTSSSVDDTAPTIQWRELLRMALSYKPQLIKANLVAITAALLSVPVPLLMPLLVDEVLLDQPGGMVALINSAFPESWHTPALYIVAVMVVTVCLRFCSLILGVIQTRQFTIISKNVTYRLRKRMLNHLQRVSMAEYETAGSGAISSHLVTDINVIDEFVGSSVSRFIVATLTLLGVTAVLLWMHWQLALFILLLNPFVIYLTTLLGKKVKTLRKKENRAVEIFQQALTETLDAIQQIRASNRQRHYLNKLTGNANDIREHATRFAWRSEAASRFSFFIFLTGFEIFRGVAMLLVVFSDLSIGQMLAVFSYLWFMMAPVQEILGIQYSYYSARAALQRLNNLLTLQPEPHYPAIHNPFKDKETVSLELEHISFQYGEGSKVLDDVNLSIAEGEKIALVGASGGGKSTLVQVVLGLYPPSDGKMLFNNVPHDEIGLDTIRANVACVLQHPALFNDSIRNNLTLGSEASDGELYKALEVAQLREVIEKMPQKLDTIVGRQGVRLSGGQRQRLAIARMILSDPKVVVLDEATSALDTATEAALHRDMQAFLQNRTTLIIAHRLSAVRQADKVYVFDGGRIIEQGHHDELIVNDGLYSRLYGHQH